MYQDVLVSNQNILLKSAWYYWKTSLRLSSSLIKANSSFLLSISIILTNCSCFITYKVFVRPSAIILFVGIQQIFIHWRCSSCLNKWEYILTCCNLVCNFVGSSNNSQMIYLLLHLIISTFGKSSISAFIERER